MSRHHLHLNARRWQAVRRTVFARDGWRCTALRARRLVFARDGWRCTACGKAGRLEVDHTVPLQRGGDPWAFDNLQILCRGCHLTKTQGEIRRQLSPAEEAWAALVREAVNFN